MVLIYIVLIKVNLFIDYSTLIYKSPILLKLFMLLDFDFSGLI